MDLDFSNSSYSWFNLVLFMTPTKILLVIVIIAFLGFAILAFQLTRGVSDLDSSSELQEAMPALPEWFLEIVVSDLKIVAFCMHPVWLYISHCACHPQPYKFSLWPYILSEHLQMLWTRFLWSPQESSFPRTSVQSCTSRYERYQYFGLDRGKRVGSTE